MHSELLGVVLVAACTMSNPEYDEDHDELGGTAEGDGGPSTSGDATTSGNSGSSTGDGDPNPNTTDGDGDGDGDPDPSTTTGDGDGDPSGDGDGDGPCPSGLEACDGACVNLQVDKNNCGSCGDPCQSGQLCAQGDCTTKKHVFVSMPTDGHFGGLEAANARCNEEADDANLPGEYRAWLSNDQQTSPSATFTKSGPYVLPGGQVVAWSWEDLTDGQLKTPINQHADEQGISPMGSCAFDVAVWTGTADDGTASGPFCGGNWESNDSKGRAGNAKATGSNWTDSNCTPYCWEKLGLYCVQQ